MADDEEVDALGAAEGFEVGGKDGDVNMEAFSFENPLPRFEQTKIATIDNNGA